LKEKCSVKLGGLAGLFGQGLAEVAELFGQGLAEVFKVSSSYLNSILGEAY
jgi:hypothetical protein